MEPEDEISKLRKEKAASEEALQAFKKKTKVFFDQKTKQVEVREFNLCIYLVLTLSPRTCSQTLTEENSRYKASLEAAELQHRQEIEQYEKRLSSASSDASYSQELIDLRRAKEDLERKTRILEENLEAAKEIHQKELVELQERMAAQIARISEDRLSAEDSHTALQDELLKLRDIKALLEQELSEQRNAAGSEAELRIKQLESELADVRSKSAAYLKKAAEGRKQLEATLEANKSKHAQEISALEERLVAQLGKIAADGDQTHEQLSRSLAEIDELKRANTGLLEELGTVKSVLDERQCTILDLEGRIREQKSESEMLKAAQSRREEEMAESSRLLNERLIDTQAASEREIAALQDRMAAQIARISGDKGRSEEQLAELAGELASLRQAKASLEEELAGLRAAEAERGAAQERAKQLEAELAEVRAKSAAYLKKAAEGRKQLEASLEAAKARHAQEVAELEGRLAAGAAEGGEREGREAALRGEAEEARAGRARLEAELEAARESGRQAEGRVRELEAEVEREREAARSDRKSVV